MVIAKAGTPVYYRRSLEFGFQNILIPGLEKITKTLE